MNEDKAARYQRHKRWVSVSALGWSVALLAALLGSGASVALREFAQKTSVSVWGLEAPATTVIVYLGGLWILHAIGELGLGLYGGFILERRYGLSTQTIGGWAADQAKALGVALVLGGVAASVTYWTMRVTSAWWWLLSGGLFATLFAVLANLAPIVLLPLFYAVKPITRASLSERLMALSERAGARVLGVYEWGLGDKSRKANAALAGLGSTRRILVSDTMLADYSDDEIEVVLAHELAHHVHGDIWKGLIFDSVLTVSGLFVAARILESLSASFGLLGVSDVAGLPLLLLSVGAVSIVMVPVAHALSRAHERRADRFALELTRNPNAFISAMRRLGAQNLAEEHPSTLVQWLFYSHPPIGELIEAAPVFRA